ncbi:hypothetical protein F511_38669 [Dorcoceras hygrometricum]|uniref:Uncharacterized protein n=1 Tax=Dorcoceras hygrometricum TaxID=472368 RepID=A0A2Z7CI25_9LAMI|nr:hypothetical protein F511_38669 [Dorcoceras hygrometricum]
MIMKRRRLERSGSACNINRCLSVSGWIRCRLNKLERRRFGVALVRYLIACVCLLVVQPKQMSTRVNIPVARGGNVVVWLALRNQSMCIFDFQTCNAAFYMLLLVPAFGGIPTMFKPVVWFSNFWLRTSRRLLFSFLGTFVVVIITQKYKVRIGAFNTAMLWLGKFVRWLLLAAVFFCSHCFVVIVLFTYHDARASGNTTLSSPCWDLLATMRRVVNYHSSWARQRQVELLMRLFLSVPGFDPMSLWGLVVFLVVLFSGKPGFTAGRGFSPAGGAPGGG